MLKNLNTQYANKHTYIYTQMFSNALFQFSNMPASGSCLLLLFSVVHTWKNIIVIHGLTIFFFFFEFQLNVWFSPAADTFYTRHIALR